MFRVYLETCLRVVGISRTSEAAEGWLRFNMWSCIFHHWPRKTLDQSKVKSCITDYVWDHQVGRNNWNGWNRFKEEGSPPPPIYVKYTLDINLHYSLSTAWLVCNTAIRGDAVPLLVLLVYPSIKLESADCGPISRTAMVHRYTVVVKLHGYMRRMNRMKRR